jgi:phospholipid transport system substrate-binding protein
MRTIPVSILSLVVLLFSLSAQANPYAYFPPYSRGVDAPLQQIREGVGRLTAFLGTGTRANPQQFMAFLEEEIAPYFDFDVMSRWAAGPLWRRMDPAQRAQMKQTLRRMFLGTLARNLANYRHSRIRYLPSRRGAPGKATVSLRAFQPNGIGMRLDFRMYHDQDGWKVFDVSANGQSAVVYYRDHFARMYPRRMEHRRW